MLGTNLHRTECTINTVTQTIEDSETCLYRSPMITLPQKRGDLSMEVKMHGIIITGSGLNRERWAYYIGF